MKVIFLITLSAFVKLDECDCPDTIDEVCGRDGNTYNNKCLADCAAV